MVKDNIWGLFQKVFYVYRERLYTINFGEENSVSPKIDISFKRITNENYKLVENLRDGQYVKEFKRMLDIGDFGVFACVNDIPVGYGWAKLENSRDYFYIIQNCYLCRFFVSSEYRGLSIYPCLIKNIMCSINKKYRVKKFYIAVEHKNTSSIYGINKIGFKFLQENFFIRSCKITFNKFQLRK
ncbi:hypothetical protein H9655_16455 [Cytobacillus sp. Sa5YUA1]|uniref:N-acetyltransferase domain-containing protein n=1 Tax=Cytobacillus stercorigallinarum TaxID=2762240 RepID=A0ABR8QSV5_9BACI|nr:hypothetical protein [Cytobacillus stercorigallinarum]MBD7938627.1 hypothetical protein [Cytobacillus stercorigallinarum]